MSLVDIVKHALPMKLADGKRHVWPTLASMVYLKDGTTPLADGDGKITADNAMQLGGKAPEYYVQPRNLLDNSDWRNPINQRGQTTYGAAGYNIDRWFSGYARPTVTINSGYVTLKNNSDTYNYHFQQKLPFGTIKAGQKYTCALKTVEGIVYRTTLTANETDTVYGRPTSDAPFEFSIRKNASDNVDVFTIYVHSLCTLNIEWLALYEGEYTDESLPPYVPKENELAACLRYFRKLGSAPSEFMVLSGHVTSGGTTILVGLPFVLDMRVKPTLTASCSLQIRGIAGYATEATASSTLTDAVFTLMPTTDGKVTLMSIKKADGTAFGNITNNTPVSVQFQGASVLEFSADL